MQRRSPASRAYQVVERWPYRTGRWLSPRGTPESQLGRSTGTSGRWRNYHLTMWRWWSILSMSRSAKSSTSVTSPRSPTIELCQSRIRGRSGTDQTIARTSHQNTKPRMRSRISCSHSLVHKRGIRLNRVLHPRPNPHHCRYVHTTGPRGGGNRSSRTRWLRVHGLQTTRRSRRQGNDHRNAGERSDIRSGGESDQCSSHDR